MNNNNFLESETTSYYYIIIYRRLQYQYQCELFFQWTIWWTITDWIDVNSTSNPTGMENMEFLLNIASFYYY